MAHIKEKSRSYLDPLPILYDNKIIQVRRRECFPVMKWFTLFVCHCHNRKMMYVINSSPKFHAFLAHLTRRVKWAIAITWRPASVVRRKLFQKSSPLKVLNQWKQNLVRIITRVYSFKIVNGDAVHQPTWPLLLKIEHMVKLQVITQKPLIISKNWHGVKMISTARSTYLAILK